MTLSIIANTLAMAINLSQTVSAVGGTAPYTFAVAPGGAGGSIDPSTGLYTSPGILGTDTLLVVDAVGKRASLQMQIGTPLDLLIDVIQQEMGLAPDRVWLFDQKINEPTDSSAYVVVRVVSSKPFANTVSFDGSGSALSQIQSTNIRMLVDISIKSRGLDALNRKEELVMALNGIYSEQQQEFNSFRIFPVPNAMTDLSQLDGAAIPYRFNLTVALQYFVTKVKAVPYFDTFAKAAVTADP